MCDTSRRRANSLEDSDMLCRYRNSFASTCLKRASNVRENAGSRDPEGRVHHRAFAHLLSWVLVAAQAGGSTKLHYLSLFPFAEFSSIGIRGVGVDLGGFGSVVHTNITQRYPNARSHKNHSYGGREN